MIMVKYQKNCWFITWKNYRTILMFLLYGFKWRKQTHTDYFIFNLKSKIRIPNFVKEHLKIRLSVTSLLFLWELCPIFVEITYKFAPLLTNDIIRLVIWIEIMKVFCLNKKYIHNEKYYKNNHQGWNQIWPVLHINVQWTLFKIYPITNALGRSETLTLAPSTFSSVILRNNTYGE